MLYMTLIKSRQLFLIFNLLINVMLLRVLCMYVDILPAKLRSVTLVIRQHCSQFLRYNLASVLKLCWQYIYIYRQS